MRPADGPLIVQSDFTVLLDGRHPKTDEAKADLAAFAELRKMPGDLHTYRITPLSLWNAAAAGRTADGIAECLRRWSRYDVPGELLRSIYRLAGRYGRLRLVRHAGGLLLQADEPALLAELAAAGSAELDGMLASKRLVSFGLYAWLVREADRGLIKRLLTKLGYPVMDLAGYHRGESLPISLLTVTKSGRPFGLRGYQLDAVRRFCGGDPLSGGSGVLVLPCGAGKTIIGIASLAELGCAALILTAGNTSVRQWRDELLDKTTLLPEQVGEYAGDNRDVRPVTIATYQLLTRRSASGGHPHMKLFGERDWGLIIYDEVHQLPAPVFRMTADIQATRRLGLTATLIREDGREKDVFSLIGPTRCELAWKPLEAEGWIASVECAEIRVPLEEPEASAYGSADSRTRARIAAENPAKNRIVARLLRQHAGKPVLVIGQYLRQLRGLSAELGIPLLTGEVPQQEREALYDRFRRGDIPVLAVSKVANFAVDLPDAAVAVQLSGSYGSRQEEAQRIGRILRPKSGDNRAWFYTLVTEGTRETEDALKRRLFLTEQGYAYRIELPEGPADVRAAVMGRGAAGTETEVPI